MALMELATQQHGVVSARQLAHWLFGRNSAAKATGVAACVELHRGVYAVGHRRLSWHSRCWAGVLGAEANEVDDGRLAGGG